MEGPDEQHKRIKLTITVEADTWGDTHAEVESVAEAIARAYLEPAALASGELARELENGRNAGSGGASITWAERTDGGLLERGTGWT